MGVTCVHVVYTAGCDWSCPWPVILEWHCSWWYLVFTGMLPLRRLENSACSSPDPQWLNKTAACVKHAFSSARSDVMSMPLSSSQREVAISYVWRSLAIWAPYFAPYINLSKKMNFSLNTNISVRYAFESCHLSGDTFRFRFQENITPLGFASKKMNSVQ